MKYIESEKSNKKTEQINIQTKARERTKIRIQYKQLSYKF